METINPHESIPNVLENLKLYYEHLNHKKGETRSEGKIFRNRYSNFFEVQKSLCSHDEAGRFFLRHYYN